ncbi:unnamed protein product [Larinioides sclopetarius]|uniref:Uncharacterized protein n=1 Tax=Larinioides sclopetarius TaxID=280406 RepID=A0AAV1YV65_9ARAC
MKISRSGVARSPKRNYCATFNYHSRLCVTSMCYQLWDLPWKTYFTTSWLAAKRVFTRWSCSSGCAEEGHVFEVRKSSIPTAFSHDLNLGDGSSSLLAGRIRTLLERFLLPLELRTFFFGDGFVSTDVSTNA